MGHQAPDIASIEAEIAAIRSLGIADLRRRWRVTFGSLPPDTLTKDLIARIIAYRIQEQAFGGLSPSLVKLLDRLAKGKGIDEARRRLKPGALLVREYEGEQHQVTVAQNGFIWEGVTYPSLSTIARRITGTKWNGPRFFGLRGPNGKPGRPQPTMQSPMRAVHSTGSSVQSSALLARN